MREQWLTTADAARALQRTPARIRQLCQAGRLPGARRHGRDWLIPASALAHVRLRPRRRGS